MHHYNFDEPRDVILHERSHTPKVTYYGSLINLRIGESIYSIEDSYLPGAGGRKVEVIT